MHTMKNPSGGLGARTVAIIPSGGMGKRMGSKKKNYLPLLGRPVLAHTIAALESSPLIDSIIIAAAPDDEGFCMDEIVRKHGFRKVARVVAGGKERQDSVRNAIEAIEGSPGIIVVHDGARPLVTAGVIERTVTEAMRTGAAIAAVPVKDTIKDVRSGSVVKTVPRENLWAVQTPQAFDREILLRAFKKADEDLFTGTDESSIVERLGVTVMVVEGSYENIKITTPEDIHIAEAILRDRGA